GRVPPPMGGGGGMLSRHHPLDVGIGVCHQGVDITLVPVLHPAAHKLGIGRQAQLVGVTRYASQTESMLRSRDTHCLSCWVPPSSTTKRFLTIGCLVVQVASRMLMPASAKVRERSSSRRVRS